MLASDDKNEPARASEKPPRLRRAFIWATVIAVAYMVWLPVSNGQVLYPAIGVMSLAALALMRRLEWPAVIVGGLLTFGVLTMWLVGNLKANLLAEQHGLTLLPTLIVWVLWANAQTPWSIRLTMRAILAAGGIGALSIVLMVGAEAGWLPALLPESVVQMQGGFVDITGDGTRIRFYGLSALAAVVPMAIAGVMLRQARTIAPLWAFALVASIGTLAALLSGRRAIALVVVATPVIVILVTMLCSSRKGTLGRPALLSAGAGVAAIFAYVAGDNPIRRAADDALATFGAADALYGETVRVRQASELLDQFARSPWLGDGLGAQLESGFFRNQERPWMFELQYHQMLLNGGFFIAIICAGLVLYVSCRAAQLARSSSESMPFVLLAAAAGAGMLIANWTNPYLIAPGHGWSIALLLGTVVAFASSRAPSKKALSTNRYKLTPAQ